MNDAAAQRAVAAMVADGTGAVLPCPWTAEDVVRFRSVARGKPESWRDIDDTLTPDGYRLALVRPLEGELVRWRVERLRSRGYEMEHGKDAPGEAAGHVVIGRESAAPSYDASMPDGVPFIPADGLVYLVVS